MLRLLAITLVLLNVVLLGVQALRPPAPPAAVDTPEIDGDVASIYLLDELPGAPGGRDGTAECFSVGPLTSLRQQEAALDLVSQAALNIRSRQTEATVESGTWVYLPPLADRETARNMALTMRDAGLGEVAVITVGEWDNAVSLGFYANSAFAGQRVAEARSLGFAVESRTRRAIEPRYWLDYEQKLGAPYVTPSGDTAIPPELHRAIPCAARSTGQAGES